MSGIDLTRDQWIALIGTVAAVIAAVAGIVAAIYAFRGDRFGRAARSRDVQPRPKDRWLGPGPLSELAFYNVGAAADHVVWAGVCRGKVFAAPMWRRPFGHTIMGEALGS